MRESASTDLREPQGSNPLGPPGPELGDLVAAMTQKRRDHRPSSAAGALSWMNEICQKENVA